MPAIVDHNPVGWPKPISVFESGAILMYLGDKTGQFLPKDWGLAVEVMEWLFLAGRRPGSDAGAEPPFLQIHAGADPLRHRAFRQ